MSEKLEEEMFYVINPLEELIKQEKAAEEYGCADDKAIYKAMAIESLEYADNQWYEDMLPEVLADLLKRPNEW